MSAPLSGRNRGPFPSPELPGFLQLAKKPTREELAIYSAARALRWQAHAGIITQREADRQLFFYRVQLEEKHANSHLFRTIQRRSPVVQQ
jgi:hypothetical protein